MLAKSAGLSLMLGITQLPPHGPHAQAGARLTGGTPVPLETSVPPCLRGESSSVGVLPSAVESHTPGLNGGFGAEHFPANVLNGPDGGPMPPSQPSDVPQNVFSLGDGGSITLRWDDVEIIDGPGADFTVFENVLIAAGSTTPFVEAGVVSVSADGAVFHTFPFRFEPPEGWSDSAPFAIPLDETHYVGLAGTRPTFTTPTNGIDPADPAVSGGNAFDLADLGLARVRYVRITDPGSPLLESSLTGTNGLKIWDLGTTLGGGNTAGFDLDTVLAINTAPRPTGDAWMLR